MLSNSACRSVEHTVHRRGFLGASLGTAAALGTAGFASASAAKQLSKSQKRVMVVYLQGAHSQLETWDPKPGTDTGGPFRAIPTSVPGTHFGELIPHTAKQAHRLSVVRSININEASHPRGAAVMLTGRKLDPAIQYPQLGAVTSKMLGDGGSGIPGHIQILARGTGGFNKSDAAFLGPKYASIMLSDGKPPANMLRPTTLSEQADREREELRKKLTDRFARSRRSAATEAYAESFDQAEQIYRKADVFDVTKEPSKIADQYGSHDFGRHLLLGRRLLEAGVTYVKVNHSDWDSHAENFDQHIEQTGEFDRTFATLLDDLSDRGMLESTLVIVMSEFGRTPRINDKYGRDHWGTAFSVAVAGCGIKPGVVVGKTNANGTAVSDREVNGGHLFHTYLRAVGLDPTKNFYPNDRPTPIADPNASAIDELLL